MNPLATLLALTCIAAADPVAIVYDTDIGNDVDDVLALGMIHALQSRGHCDLFALSASGTVTIGDDGFTRFKPGGNGRHRFLILDQMRTARVRETMVQLCSQPNTSPAPATPPSTASPPN